MKHLNIGLFGFGVVGEGIYKVLKEKPEMNTVISKVCIKHPEKERNAPLKLFTTNKKDILEDPNINVVVELIDDADAALEIVSTAMKKGKSVVSANKKMIAENHSYLIALQKETGVSFLYEAAVCGSIPILRNLEEYFDNDLLNYVSGIVNGSTNYILSKMKNENSSFSDSLKDAQENGFAESDPSLDIQGLDAAYKLSIITLHAFGKLTDPKSIIRKGITSLDPFDFNYAAEKGLVIKLLATTQRDENSGELFTNIFPTFISKDKTLSKVNNEFNGVLIGCSLADEQFLYGKGAGRYPTSSAVLSDISALRYNYKYEYRKGNDIHVCTEANNKKRFYLGFNKELKIDFDVFDSVKEHYKNCERGYIIGDITLNKLKSTGYLEDESLSLIAFQ